MDSFALFMLVVVIASAVVGWVKGFISQTAQVLGLVLGIIACRVFGSTLTAWIGEPSMLNTVIAYILIFVIVYVLVWMLGNLIRGAMRALHVGVLNKVAGAVFSIVKWVLVVSLILNLYAAVLPNNALSASRAYNITLDFGPRILGMVFS